MFFVGLVFVPILYCLSKEIRNKEKTIKLPFYYLLTVLFELLNHEKINLLVYIHAIKIPE